MQHGTSPELESPIWNRTIDGIAAKAMYFAAKAVHCAATMLLRWKDAGFLFVVFLFGAQALHRVYLGCAARGCQNSERCHGKNQ